MTLASGSRLGPYEVLAPLGAGGMGEVYRARDAKLHREVAVKVLPESLANDADALARFEREARAVAALSHPNILAIFDFGRVDGTAFAVTELLQGETLRARLAGGPLPPRKALEFARQLAHGLAAAHEKGIVHRDLKPENIFVTGDGRVKILDFGLAKSAPREPAPGDTNTPTASRHTDPGVVLGTVGYMSPEQVKGKPADARSDIFAFGAVLYEMLSGVRAFQRDSAAETMSAVLREDPPDLSATNRNVPPGLERIVRHCLEKSPGERFQSARDVAFDLEALSEVSAPGVAVGAGPPRRGVALPVAVAIALVTGAAGYALRARKAPAPLPSFRQLTYRRGALTDAFFGADGVSVAYAASWDGGSRKIYLGRSDGPDSHAFGMQDAGVLALSSTGEMAIELRPRPTGSFTLGGTLARVAAAGGAPREVLENVEFADFSPDGRDLAVVRVVAGRRRLELPIGKVLYETAGWIGNPRFSRRGDRIAFLDHPLVYDDAGRVSVVDLSGKKKDLTSLFASAQGLAWSPDGSEIWFTAAEAGGNRWLHAVNASGRVRDLYRGAGVLTLHDVARDGRALLSHDVLRIGLLARAPGETRERDLSWFDWSLLADVSPDGRTLLFSETGEGGGVGYSVFLRNVDGSPAVRLGEGVGRSISPDGKWVLVLVHSPENAQLVAYPTGPGEPRTFPLGKLHPIDATWLPDGRRFLLVGGEPGKSPRVFLVDADRPDPKPLTPEGVSGFAILDANRFIVRRADRTWAIHSVDGGAPVPVKGLGPDDSLIGPTARAGWVYVRRGGSMPPRIVQVELATGLEEPWKELTPPDPTGVVAIPIIRIVPDGRACAYSCTRQLSELYAVDGVK